MTINKQQAKALVQEFLAEYLGSEEWYVNVKAHLKAIIFYGSVAKGTNRADSDIDILFILPLETEKACTKGEYVYNFQNHEINIVIRSIEKLKIIAAGQPDPFQAEIFRESEIIWQNDKEVSKLIMKIME